MNYYDLLKSSGASQNFSYLNDKYIELNAPSLKIFKLDKKATVLDDLYGFEVSSRIYLPPFDIRGLYKTNEWKLLLDASGPVAEQESEITFVVNLNRMVTILRDLKNKHIAEIKVNYSSALPFNVPAVEKTSNKFIFYVNSSEVGRIDLTVYRSVKNLVSQINNIPGFSAIYDINDEVSNIDDFSRKSFRSETLLISSRNRAYDNCTEVIEMGDLVLTDKWRLYEVKQAHPSGDYGWDWSTYSLDCNLIEIDIADGLPGDYRKLIEKHQYGLPKVSKE